VWYLGAVFLIDYEATSVVCLQADGFEVEASRDWSATYGGEDNIGIKSFFFATLCSFDVDLDTFSMDLTSEDLGVELEFYSLLLKNSLRGLCHFGVHTWSSDLTKEFNNGDFRAQS